jgi:hypothetical protein
MMDDMMDAGCWRAFSFLIRQQQQDHPDKFSAPYLCSCYDYDRILKGLYKFGYEGFSNVLSCIIKYLYICLIILVKKRF